MILLCLAATVSCSYYIVDTKHGRSLCAENRSDGRIYHQDPNGRRNAKWTFEAIPEEPSLYLIRDMLHKKYIIAGNTFDGNIYQEASPNNRSNAMWHLHVVPFKDDLGSTTFYLIDEKQLLLLGILMMAMCIMSILIVNLMLAGLWSQTIWFAIVRINEWVSTLENYEPIL